jgi:hypothetical protein
VLQELFMLLAGDKQMDVLHIIGAHCHTSRGFTQHRGWSQGPSPANISDAPAASAAGARSSAPPRLSRKAAAATNNGPTGSSPPAAAVTASWWLVLSTAARLAAAICWLTSCSAQGSR